MDIATTSRLMSNNACDGLGLKLTRLGGLHPFSVVRDVSEANAIPITCDDTFGGDIIAAACVHGGATVNPRLLEGVWVATTYVHGNYGEPSEITVTNGSIDIPTGPGLGVTPNEAGLGAPRLSFG